MTAQKLEHLDPERRRLRVQLLAELAEARALRGRAAPHQAHLGRFRDFVTQYGRCDARQ